MRNNRYKYNLCLFMNNIFDNSCNSRYKLCCKLKHKRLLMYKNVIIGFLLALFSLSLFKSAKHNLFVTTALV